MAAWEADKAALEEEIAKKEDEEKRRALKEGRVWKKKEHKRLDLRPPPRLDDEALDAEEEDELPMYFTRPQQLLDIFTQLEESNLFLIQNCQETEQQLEELKQQYRETERSMSKQTESLEVCAVVFACVHVCVCVCVCVCVFVHWLTLAAAA